MKCLVALSLAVSIGNVAVASAASARNLAPVSHAQQATSGITEFPLPVARSFPQGITVGPDGNIWFTETGRNRIGKITALGAITEYPLPPWQPVHGNRHQYPDDIITGPDGALWVSMLCGIARIDLSGKMTNCYKAVASSLLAGPDGNIWFLGGMSLDKTGIVGRMTTSGNITLFDLPLDASDLSGLAIGPDDNIWFDSWGGYGTGDAVNVLSTSGVLLSAYSLPRFTYASGLAVGANGNMWVTAPSFIGQLRAKRVVEYRSRAVSYGGLVAGPEQSVWFCMPDGIGQSDMRGHITRHRLPHPNAIPLNLTVGPDGAIWFTEYHGNAIGRLQP